MTGEMVEFYENLFYVSPSYTIWAYKQEIFKYTIIDRLNPSLTKLFFVTRLTKGVVTTPSLDSPIRAPYETDFGINR